MNPDPEVLKQACRDLDKLFLPTKNHFGCVIEGEQIVSYHWTREEDIKPGMAYGVQINYVYLEES